MENAWTNDRDRYVLEAHPGESQGRPERQGRARSASSKTACPATFSTTRTPGPGEPLVRDRPVDSCQVTIFMPRQAAAPARTVGSSGCGSTAAAPRLPADPDHGHAIARGAKRPLGRRDPFRREAVVLSAGQGLGRRPAFVVARASSRRQRQSRNARDPRHSSGHTVGEGWRSRLVRASAPCR